MTILSYMVCEVCCCNTYPLVKSLISKDKRYLCEYGHDLSSNLNQTINSEKHFKGKPICKMYN